VHITIVANAPHEQFDLLNPRLHPAHLPPGDILIAADGGAHHCLELGINPDYVIGDLDSLDSDHLERLQALGSQIIRYPTRKDYTDLELAIQFAQKLETSEIIILAALGDRWDQTIANLLLPLAFPDLKISLFDGNQEIHLLRDNTQMTLHGQPGDTVSLIPLSLQAQGIITQNLEYPLAGETLYLGSTRGVSNRLLASPASISLKEGVLLCILIHTRADL
jgi:thiamine pyrophosphokinase